MCIFYLHKKKVRFYLFYILNFNSFWGEKFDYIIHLIIGLLPKAICGLNLSPSRNCLSRSCLDWMWDFTLKSHMPPHVSPDLSSAVNVLQIRSGVECLPESPSPPIWWVCYPPQDFQWICFSARISSFFGTYKFNSHLIGPHICLTYLSLSIIQRPC